MSEFHGCIRRGQNGDGSFVWQWKVEKASASGYAKDGWEIKRLGFVDSEKEARMAAAKALVEERPTVWEEWVIA